MTYKDYFAPRQRPQNLRLQAEPHIQDFEQYELNDPENAYEKVPNDEEF
jgi:hypothetical protein